MKGTPPRILFTGRHGVFVSQRKNFCPSGVPLRSLFAPSIFQDEAKEAASALIVAFLAAHGDVWDTAFTWETFWKASSEAEVHSHYGGFTQPYSERKVLQTFHALVNDGYLTEREEKGKTHFHLTEKYVDFFRFYAS